MSRYKRNQTYVWNQEVQTCYSVGKVVRQLLQELSPKFYKVEAISDDGFRDFDLLIDEFQSEEIVINQLMEVLHDERRYTLCYFNSLVFKLECGILTFM